MPPSEQNPAPMNQPFPNVPEYLHLDPIPEPKAPQSKKKIILILTAIALVVLLAASAAAAWLYMSGEPERRLYTALENSMKVGYVTQKIVTKVSDEGDAMFETSYNLSDPAQPKAHSIFTMNSENVSVNGEIIIPDATHYYVKFSKIPTGSLSKGVVTEQWYKATKSNLAKAPVLIKSINFDRLNQAIFGNIIFGKLNDSAIAVLMEYIKNNDVYVIDDSTVDGRQAVYSLTLNSQHIGNLNKLLTEQLNVQLPSIYEQMIKNKATQSKHTLFIDIETNKISQIIQTATDEKTKETATITTSYSFPSTYSVKIPQDAKEVVGA